MLTFDPIPWLMAQEGLPAVRARRLLHLDHEGDAEMVAALECELAAEQLADGSFDGSPINTAGVLNLLGDLRARKAGAIIEAGAAYLTSVLESQPGYGRAKDVTPGSLDTPCDLCGFFGPYHDRGRPEVMAHGAREMNYYRRYEPLLGPKSPVRGLRRSSLDRAGPASCYSWGLIPLAYTVESLCRAGYALDTRLQPAIHALLGAQRKRGGWCRNLGGDLPCTIHPLRVLGAHPTLSTSVYAERVLYFMRTTQQGRLDSKTMRWWRGANLYGALQAVAAFDLPIAREILRDALAAAVARQRKNGSFGTPHPVERAAAVLLALQAIGSRPQA